MKCIGFTDGKVLRVSDDEAATEVKRGSAAYVAKKAWKKLRNKEGDSK